LRTEGDGDGTLFKGILARHLTDLGGEGPQSVVLATAESHWANRDAIGRFGLDPETTPAGRVQLSAMVAGVIVVEMAARIERGSPGPKAE
jgi:predicted alpha-1,6-mannanase (GH76 family)